MFHQVISISKLECGQNLIQISYTLCSYYNRVNYNRDLFGLVTTLAAILLKYAWKQKIEKWF